MNFRDLWNLSFEDSKTIAMNRFGFTNGYLDNTRIRSINFDFFVRIFAFFIVFVFVINAYINGRMFFSHNVKLGMITGIDLDSLKIAFNTSKILCPLLDVLSILVIVADIVAILPSKNFGKRTMKGYILIWLLYLQIITSITPAGVGLANWGWGTIATVITIIWFPIWIYMNIHNANVKKLRKLKKEANSEKFPLTTTLLVVLIVCFVLALLNGSFNLYRIIKGGLLFAAYTISGPILSLLFSAFLTMHYILKYPDQYRMYYKITDAAWWLSSRRAKKHKRVYPIPKVGESNGENRD